MNPLELVKLPALMQRTSGRSEIIVALIDGPVLMDRRDLWTSNVRHLSSRLPASCTRPTSDACMHGTFVAGILSTKRGSPAPAICPNCTLLVRSVFSERANAKRQMPSATPLELADAIVDTVTAGAHVINLSLSVINFRTRGEQQLEAALDYAASRGAIVIAAAGNNGEVGATVISRHPWVIPVTGCDLQGRPTSDSNLGCSIGRFGLSAPSEDITSLGPNGTPETFTGTSAAAPFVSGTVALLWSEFPAASASDLKLAVSGVKRQSRKTVVPPILDAWAAYLALATTNEARKVS
jgi:subtilisin family serine protease